MIFTEANRQIVKARIRKSEKSSYRTFKRVTQSLKPIVLSSVGTIVILAVFYSVFQNIMQEQESSVGENNPNNQIQTEIYGS